MTKIAVEIWSDFLCPWCYLGKRRFEAALSEFERAEDVRVRWRSYDLHPDEKKVPDLTIPRRLERDLGLSLSEAEAAVDQVGELAAELGLRYRMRDALLVNSFDAHRLAHFAEARGHGNDFRERLMRAYTGEGANIADHASLLQFGVDAGLDKDDARALLDSDDYSDAVRDDHREGRAFGVSGVPTVIVNRQFVVSGAASSAAYLDALRRAVTA
ncbi:DsbA family oxidoreductase [Amycolatopsis halotolerans]|uniref:DsbA family oxidoreductase n=1 Tax=Amycolatopsis halotolerans TaxID=330083 RepID=A0ABV7QA65_9PSEU